MNQNIVPAPPPLKQFSKSICFQLSGKPLSLSFVQVKTFHLPPFCPMPFLGFREKHFRRLFSSRGNANFISASFSKYISRREKCPPPKRSNKIQRNPMIVLSGRAYALSYACEETTLHAITSLCIFPTKTILHF